MNGLPSHVAFVTSTAWFDDVTTGLAVRAQRVELSTRWWRRRTERLSSLVGPLRPGPATERLTRTPRWAGAVKAAPAVVRLAAVARLEAAAEHLEQMLAIAAPAVVLDAARAQVEASFDALDPAAAFPLAVPEGVEHPSSFLEAMVVAAQAEQPSSGVGPFEPSEPQPPVLSSPDPVVPELVAASSAFGFWFEPRFALPRVLSTRGLWVRMEASGPVSCACADDAVGERVAPGLGALVAGLREGEVLVSFVWSDDSVTGPWRPVVR